MDTESVSWLKVVFYTAVLIIGFIFWRDYSSAPEEWRAGRVADKEVYTNYHRKSYTSSRSYHILVDCGSTRGVVSVDQWTYADWQVGQACEIASRHGHYMNYDFTNLRRPQCAERSLSVLR
jgi:hypothetical protein